MNTVHRLVILTPADFNPSDFAVNSIVPEAPGFARTMTSSNPLNAFLSVALCLCASVVNAFHPLAP